MTNGPTKMMTAIHHLAGVTLTAALFLLLAVGYWLFYPSHGFTRVDIDFVDRFGHVDQGVPAVYPGDDLAYQVSYCVDERTPVPVTVRRAIQLQNHVVTYGLSELGYLITQPCESVIRVLSIPAMVRPGEYRVKVYTDIQTSPIRRVYQDWESPVFKVLER